MPFGHGYSKIRRSSVPYIFLSASVRNLNVASASSIIRARMQANTTPFVAYACWAAANRFSMDFSRLSSAPNVIKTAAPDAMPS